MKGGILMKKDIKKILDESRWTILYGSEINPKSYASVCAYAFGLDNNGLYIITQTQYARYIHVVKITNGEIELSGIPFVVPETVSINEAVKEFNGFVLNLKGYMGLSTISEVHTKDKRVLQYDEEGTLTDEF